MPFIPRQEPFVCDHCGMHVQPLAHGTYRNHCPGCLFSKHVDLTGPGDRANPCHGLMQPVIIDQDGKKGFVIVHHCLRCAATSRNRACSDDDLVGFAQRINKTD